MWKHRAVRQIEDISTTVNSGFFAKDVLSYAL